MRAVPLARADIPHALRLVEECGWNQVEADWEIFVDNGAALKVPAQDGISATAATLPYPPSFGWISMVLVTKSHRRQGIATELLQQCIDRLQAESLVPMLDATPAGREVYRQLGFTDGWAITRWRRTADAVSGGEPAANVRPFRDSDWHSVIAMDSQAFGADRSELLRQLAQRSRDFACVAESGGEIRGFLFGREGRLATQFGPIVAHDADTAQGLLAHALYRTRGPVLVDALDRHEAFAQQLAQAGFQVERGYTRMALGAGRTFGDEEIVVAIAGPELG